jgi:hypothetical protein
VLDFLCEGDVLMVTRIDRLARSIGDFQDIVRAIRAKGAALKATEQPIDTSTAAGKCFLDMLGVFAEFETNLRRERQLEGIAKAKAAGAYNGRSASIDATRVREMRSQGMGLAPSPRRSVFAGRAAIGCWRRINGRLGVIQSPSRRCRHSAGKRLVMLAAPVSFAFAATATERSTYGLASRCQPAGRNPSP